MKARLKARIFADPCHRRGREGVADLLEMLGTKTCTADDVTLEEWRVRFEGDSSDIIVRRFVNPIDKVTR